MAWLFEWNWLGYLWTILIGGQLLAVAGIFAGEIASVKETGEGQRNTDRLFGYVAISLLGSSVLLCLVTIFFWNLRTALWLLVATSLMMAVIFGFASIVMRLISR